MLRSILLFNQDNLLIMIDYAYDNAMTGEAEAGEF